jgi:hypothetical protein
LPPDQLNAIEPDVASLIRSLAGNAGTTPQRVLALVQKSQEILKKDGIDADIESLVSAAHDIDEQAQGSGIPNNLAEYINLRRSGLNHSAAVKQVIYDRVSGRRVVAKDVGSFRWQFTYERSSSKADGLGYYIVVGSIENTGKTELKVPDHGIMMILVDRQSREYSAHDVKSKDVVLRPSIPVPFAYGFKVPADARVSQFKIRELDGPIDQFEGDRFQIIQVEE